MAAGETGEALVAAAVALLDEGGPGAVTLREVGRRAGVSHNAPYKHFADKEALLAAVAARELAGQGRAVRDRLAGPQPPGGVVRSIMHAYVAWALAYPARFKLVYGAWTRGSAELGEAAAATRSAFVSAVAEAQQAGQLPAGDPERLTALLLALAHGAVDLALAGHLAAAGKGRANPSDLVDDLLTYLGPPTSA
ncbi:TetR family transcriptional regulator [Frankia sp. CcI49]|uniref:TetR/AcrR family transcriptional regulator n=1 Tax=unclassified Frankia TaxID=2632575 RepID=UPI0006C9FD51|nr:MULTISPECIES: TetR/AcrR family transcriptional regulator [unclassified Frankia]KPM52608.1 TetR family transcriptional regulator [Frankia sp. R43]ONH60090.1 TetR family transcriptional regulator [Frankia sp. CcI49]